MTNVEQIYPGYHWGDPLQGLDLDVVVSETALQITGRPPTYAVPGHPSDMVWQYDNSPRQVVIGQARTGMLAPDVSFANADTDDKLVAFVKRFGPVVASHILDTRVTPDPESGKREAPGRMVATQDLQELRNEQAIFRAAFELAVQLNSDTIDDASIQPRIRVIAEKIRKWSRQWERECELRSSDWGRWADKPKWQLTTEALQRIVEASESRPDPFFGHKVDGRVVVCELLNTFPGIAFPNLVHLHASIKLGIRPLLYSLLRRRFAFPRGTDVCASTQCRNYFNREREGQKFCSTECSRRQRQREYWQKSGKDLRRKRSKKRVKPAKGTKDALKDGNAIPSH